MLNNPKSSQATIGNRSYSITTGKLAKQANGSVTIHCGETVLLATAVMSSTPKDIDFFPLTVEFAEKMYAAGKIPGGFFKREARPSTRATLTSRLIDRPIRPIFPSGIRNEIQIIITVLSYDESFPPEALGITAASAALSVSDIPFNGPAAGVLVGRVNGQFIANPSKEELAESDLDIVVAGTKEAILMVEAGAKQVSEEDVIAAIEFAHGVIKEFIALQEDLVNQAGKTKLVLPAAATDDALKASIAAAIGSRIADNLQNGNKQETTDFLNSLRAEILEQFSEEGNDDRNKLVESLYNKVQKDAIRKAIIQNKCRPDGRKLDEIRPIEVEVGVLPKPHGSALFTRGETQSLATVTLGTSEDGQMIDGLDPLHTENYLFHYNFPPFSVGECGRMGTGRRELGHGALAGRALEAVLPEAGTFPYTIRVVSDILESNGSSSMASVCAGSLSLMDTGVPIQAPVSGIAMGLLIDEGNYAILSDIQGLEDHYGDMDFKVAGTEKGITALQLDIKVAGLSKEILTNALAQAKKGRLEILNKMSDAISIPRAEISPKAPRIETIMINPEKVGLLIGPGGKTIRQIEEQSGATVVVSDGNSGEVNVSAVNGDALSKAISIINNLVRDVQVGDVYNGRVCRITNFGAFVELKPGKDGLLHISKISKKRVNKVEDFLQLDQVVEVKVEEIDAQHRVNLSLVTAFE